MKCFRHAEVEAVGTCKVCSKGLCSDCAADLGHAIACRESCEAAAERIEAIIQHSTASVRTQKRNRYLAPTFLAVMGLTFLAFGLKDGPEFNLGTVMGSGFLIFAAVHLLVVRSWARQIGEGP